MSCAAAEAAAHLKAYLRPASAGTVKSVDSVAPSVSVFTSARTRYGLFD